MSKANRKKKIQKRPAPRTAAPTRLWWMREKWMAIGVALLGFLLYANTLTHNYTQDDAIVIYENEFTTLGAQGIKNLFRYDTFRGFFKEENKANLVEGGRYRPLTPAMMALEVELFTPLKKDEAGNPVLNRDGVAVHNTDPSETLLPTVGHTVNALLYGGVCALLYWILITIFRKRFDARFAAVTALAAALLFTVHPVHPEVVANIKGRDEIMTLMGALLALYASLRAYETGKIGWLIGSGLFFFIGLLSKENAITFLAVIPATFYVFTKANWAQIGKLMVPLLVATGIFLGLRANALRPPEGLSQEQIERIKNRPKDLMNDPFQKLENNTYVPFSFGEKTATIATTLIRYVGLLVVPYPLTHDYYPRHIDVASWTHPLALLALLVYLGIGLYVLWRLPRRDVVAYGLLVYLASLSIVSNLFFPIGTNMAERFLFMPSVGFCVVVGYLLAKWGERKPASNYRTTWIVLGLVSFLFAAWTLVRNLDWKDNYTLFLKDIAVSENSAKLQNSVGGELIAQSVLPQNENRRTEMLRRATRHLTEAIRIHPGFKNAHLLLGNAYNYLEEYDLSIQAYKNALQLDDDYEEAINNLAITYRAAGQFYGEKQNDLVRSLDYLNKAYDLRPNDFETARLLGVAYGRQGNNQRAIAYFTRATEIEPTNAGAFYDLGTAYHFAGNAAKRDELHAKALQMEPDLLEKRKQNRNN